MAYTREQQIDDAFFALSHPVRRAVLEHLAQEDLSVSDISKPFKESPSQMTKHLHILERAGMMYAGFHGVQRFVKLRHETEDKNGKITEGEVQPGISTTVSKVF